MLDTVDSVLEALGGPAKAAALAGVGLPAVSNWRSRGKIAQGKFVIFKQALEGKGLEASPAVFGFKSNDGARP